jgi:hypothetical protein
MFMFEVYGLIPIDIGIEVRNSDSLLFALLMLVAISNSKFKSQKNAEGTAVLTFEFLLFTSQRSLPIFHTLSPWHYH